MEDLKDRVITALKKVNDPELAVSVWDLGLIYEVIVKDEGRVNIKMTLTAPGCPFMAQLVDQVGNKISQVDGVDKVDVDLVFDPPWSPERLTKKGREKLGFDKN